MEFKAQLVSPKMGEYSVFLSPIRHKKVFVVIVFWLFFLGGDFSSWWLEKFSDPSAGDEKFEWFDLIRPMMTTTFWGSQTTR